MKIDHVDKDDQLGLRIAFGGDREIAVKVLGYILDQGVRPLVLLLPEEEKASHLKELKSLCSYLPADRIWYGKQFRSPEKIALLQSMNLDYIVCIHLPLIIPKVVLEIPKEGVINLHPAFLPYSRGWHPSIWACLEENPYGATLHFMDEGVDTGDIIHQQQLPLTPEDTGDSMYKKALSLEFDVFQEAWPSLINRTYKRIPQTSFSGTFHKMKELYESGVQKIDLDEMIRAGDLIRKMRAMTTNKLDEASYFEVGSKKYHLQVRIYSLTE